MTTVQSSVMIYMLCFHFVDGDHLSRTLRYWLFPSRAMFMGCAFGALFRQRAPLCSTVLVSVPSLRGWPSSATILLARLSVSFPMWTSGFSFCTLDYVEDGLHVLTLKCLSHAHAHPP